MDTLGYASRGPKPRISQALTPTILLEPKARRTAQGDHLVVTLDINENLTLHFTGATPDPLATDAIDHLIDGLQQLRRLVVTLQADPDIVAAVSEQVTRA